MSAAAAAGQVLPVDWRRVERIRAQGQTHYVMVAADRGPVLVGYLLRREVDGDLDFQTVPGEDGSSRRLWMVDLALISKRTPLQQVPSTGAWVPRAAPPPPLAVDASE